MGVIEWKPETGGSHSDECLEVISSGESIASEKLLEREKDSVGECGWSARNRVVQFVEAVVEDNKKLIQ